MKYKTSNHKTLGDTDKKGQVNTYIKEVSK